MVNNKPHIHWTKPHQEIGPINNLTDLGFVETKSFTKDQSDELDSYVAAMRESGKRPAVDYALILIEEEKRIPGQRGTTKTKVMKVLEK